MLNIHYYSVEFLLDSKGDSKKNKLGKTELQFVLNTNVLQGGGSKSRNKAPSISTRW